MWKSFWTNIRRQGLFLHRGGIADCPPWTPEAIEKHLLDPKHDHWLKPHTADQFREEHFDFLSEEEIKRLADSVRGVRVVAQELIFGKPATTDQRERALPAYTEMVQILGFDRYEDAEAFRIGKQIWRSLAPSWPVDLTDLRFETGLDSSGDPALWIWAYLSAEAASTDDAIKKSTRTIRTLLQDVSHSVAGAYFPYVNFRSAIDEFDSEAA